MPSAPLSWPSPRWQTPAVPEIRAARDEDAARLREIDVLTWSPLVSPMPVKGADVPFFDDRLSPSDTLVATSGARVCGFVLLQQTSSPASHAHVLLVNGLGVDPDHQGQGVGRLLLEAAVREARARGARKVSLRVLSTNTSARRLYASLGFVVEGVLRGEFVLDGRPVDDVLMARYLDDPDGSP